MYSSDGDRKRTNMYYDASDAIVKKKPKIDDINKAIVYTTKLDQMKIFKGNITEINIETIIESIIRESKPNVHTTHKRKCNKGIDHHISYECLLCHINTLNTKVANKIKKRNKHLLAMCKPLRIVLHDIKHSLHIKWNPQTICKEISDTQIVNKPVPKDVDKPLTLAPPFIRNPKYTVIHDNQQKEADLYSFEKKLVKEYATFNTDDVNDKISSFLASVNDKSFVEVNCCCWYGRDKFITSSLTPQCTETLRFMRKSHKCSSDRCTCCCRKEKSLLRDMLLLRPTLMNTSSVKPVETNAWFKTLTEKHKLLTDFQLSTSTLIPKSLSVTPRVKQGNIRVEETKHFLHSTDIELNDEYYRIGSNGEIDFFCKGAGSLRYFHCNNHLSHMSPTINKIKVNICCWYKREQFAVHLVKFEALPNTVNFIRNAHQCSITNCNCCCKPNNEKMELTLLPIAPRHTNDQLVDKIKFRIQFPQILNKSKPHNSRISNMFTFNLSFKKYLLEIQKTPLLTLSTRSKIMSILKKITNVQFYVNNPPDAHSTSANVNLNTISKTELKILDRIFTVIESFKAEDSNETVPTHTIRKIAEHSDPLAQETTACETKKIPNMCKTKPSTLYSQLSIVAKLKTKRYIPSFRGYAKAHNLSDLKNIFEVYPNIDFSVTKS